MADARPTDAPIGEGAAKVAVSKIEAMKQYNSKLLAAQENGDTMPPFTEWFAGLQKASTASGALAGGVEQ